MHSFYRAFEERHRGPRELIKSRFEVYLPFVEPCKTLFPNSKIIDLGCGRGEWIELLHQHEVQACGVDVDEYMLLACRERGLDVVNADIFDYLKDIESESVIMVSAFHVVEHISFDNLVKLVNEIHRILRPGGLLLFETPNSENIVVGTSNFYMDPTHLKPLPASLLSFVVEYAKFERIKVLYLQESRGVVDGKEIGLFDVFSGASADYGVVAQKKSTEVIMRAFDEPFSCTQGVRLRSLAERYDMQINLRMKMLETKLNLAESNLVRMVDKISDQAESDIKKAEEKVHYWWVVADGYKQELEKTYGSVLWLTHDFVCKNLQKCIVVLLIIIRLPLKILIKLRKTIQKRLLRVVFWLSDKLWLKKKIIRWISKFPKLKNHLRSLIYGKKHPLSQPTIIGIMHLSPYEASLYAMIKREIDRSKRGSQ